MSKLDTWLQAVEGRLAGLVTHLDGEFELAIKEPSRAVRAATQLALDLHNSLQLLRAAQRVVAALEQCREGAFVMEKRGELINSAKQALDAYYQVVWAQQ